jgi:hypothetical protein
MEIWTWGLFYRVHMYLADLIWPGYNVVELLSRALPAITFLSHIRKVAFWVWTFSWAESAHVFVRAPSQRHRRAKGVRPRLKAQVKNTGRLFMLITMVPKMQVFLRIGARASLFAGSWKNASWMRNFWFTIVVYVNIKQFSSRSTTGMIHMYTGVWQGWPIIQRLNLALAWPTHPLYCR